MSEHTFTSAADLSEHLKLLYAERNQAAFNGLAENGLYMAELDGDIAESRAAFVGAAVTEIATLRGELSGRNQG